jgi:hypothetical protein
MTFDDVWDDLLATVRDLPAEAVLLTPTSNRPFEVVGAHDTRVDVAYLDGDEERSLRRDRFAILHHRIEELRPEGVRISKLPPGADPYVAVLSLHPAYEIDDEHRTLTAVEGGSATRRLLADEGVPETETGTDADALHADALLLADSLERHDAGDPGDLATDTLVNLYVLLSDVQRGADRVRRSVSDELLGRVDVDQPVYGQFGAVLRTTRGRRHLKEDDEVYAALDDLDIPREWVTGVVREKVDVVLSVTDLDEADVYDVEEQTYVQKTDVAEDAKASRLQGLRERLDALESEEAAELQAEVEELEARLDELLAAE